MNANTLKLAMKFPSGSPEENRAGLDLGRFGLGLKTASFSQTRKFTVISRKKASEKYSARTWDVEALKTGKWRVLVNTDSEINDLLEKYKSISSNHINEFSDFQANTIIFWHGLYKYENYIDEINRENALKKDLSEITAEHLEIVFHRFMEKKDQALKIRINNKMLKPFNPFPTHEKDFRALEPLTRKYREDAISIQGFVLPSKSIDDLRAGSIKWTTKHRSLMGMEGIYIYRCNRIILFGGWNRLIKKAPRLQLARLRVDIGNGVDDLINLNVAKSQVIIPHDLKKAFEEYIQILKSEAEKEYFNRGLKKFNSGKKLVNNEIFTKSVSNKGAILDFNDEFPILRNLKMSLKGDNLSKLNLLLRIVKTNINRIRQVHEEKRFCGIEEEDGLSEAELILCISELTSLGLSPSIIKERIVDDLGFVYESLPAKAIELLEI